jgi:hypothetical protein
VIEPMHEMAFIAISLYLGLIVPIFDSVEHGIELQGMVL